MGDRLARLLPVATDLLGRVDSALDSLGAPPGHPVLPLVRRLRVLPGGAIAGIAGLDPAPLRAAGLSLRARTRSYPLERLDRTVAWSGEAHAAFADHWAGRVAHAAALVERLDATAEYAEGVADWIVDLRIEVAAAVMEVLGSAEATRVRLHPSTSARAAADIGAHVLRPIEAGLGAGLELLRADLGPVISARRHGPDSRSGHLWVQL